MEECWKIKDKSLISVSVLLRVERSVEEEIRISVLPSQSAAKRMRMGFSSDKNEITSLQRF